MIKKIKLKNFMSHKDSELELCAGVNVLIGPNNSGKSAIVTALQLLTELPTREGTYMIRHGEKEAVVTVETSDGDVITWGRKESSSFLVINGERHVRLSNNQANFLNELHKILKLPQVKNKEECFDIHFASQKHPIFLLDDPPSRAATFFSVSSDAGRLVEVRDLFKTKVNKAKEKKNVLERRQAVLKLELEKLEPLKSIEEQIVHLKKEYDEILQQEKKLEQGLFLLKEFKQAKNKVGYIERNTLILSQMIDPPMMDEVASCESLCQEIHIQSQKQRVLQEKVVFLSELKIAQEFESGIELSRAVTELNDLLKKEDIKSKEENCLANLMVPPEIENCEILEESVKKLKALEQEQKTFGQKVEKAKQALLKWIDDNKACPTCGSLLKQEHLFTHD